MQAVTLVFEHVGTADGVGFNAVDGHAQANGHVVREPEGNTEALGSPVLARHGAANAALKLLDDLCMMATGRPAHRQSFSLAKMAWKTFKYTLDLPLLLQILLFVDPSDTVGLDHSFVSTCSSHGC